MLYKRRPILPKKESVVPEDENTEVWYLEETNEFFNEYEDYLDRMDYYHERMFTCELTGTSHLTYFEALKCETDEMEHIFRTFPEALKEPILRKVQQCTVTRMDGVVDALYTQLRHDFFPGEVLIFKDPATQNRIRVVIREKATFPEMILADGTKRPAANRYRVETVDEPKRELLGEDSNLVRDRRLFTKVSLRAFLKHSITRNPRYYTSPWGVKPEYAERYRIEQPSINIVTTLGPPTSAPTPTPREERKKAIMIESSAANTPGSGLEGSPGTNGIPGGTPVPGAPGTKGRKKRARYGNSELEDDLSPLIYDAENETLRPKLSRHDLDGKLVGPLLEIWLFINMYHEPLIIDAFNFDDLVWALKFYDLEDNECLLLSEIHCALLCLMVGTKNNNLLITIPENTENETLSDGDDSMEVDDVKEEDEKEEKENGKRNEDDDEDEEDGSDNSDKENEDEAKKQHAKSAKTTSATYANYQNVSWTERLRKRMFKDGGWQQILIGLLHSVQNVEEWEHSVRRILQVMASKDRSVTLASARNGYSELSMELKVRVLEILCQLAFVTPEVRTFIDQRIEEVTKLRKEKADLLKEQKQLRDTASRAKIDLDKTGDDEESDNENDNAANTNTNNEDTTNNNNNSNNNNTETPKPDDSSSGGDDIVQKYSANRQAINALEAQILERDIQRVSMLGRDRYFNRYWWFEHNGVQIEEQGYGVGRLWVQGPSEEESRVYLGSKRTKVENGNETNGIAKGPSNLYDTKIEQDGLFTEEDWGFYEEPEQFEKLLKWLKPSGRREASLLKELKRCGDKISKSMRTRLKELEDDKLKVAEEINETIREEFGEDEPKNTETDGEEEEEPQPPVTRRRRAGLRGGPKIVDTHQRNQDIAARRSELQEIYDKEMPERVMEWTNSAAEAKFGQSHYEGNRPSRPKR